MLIERAVSVQFCRGQIGIRLFLALLLPVSSRNHPGTNGSGGLAIGCRSQRLRRHGGHGRG